MQDVEKMIHVELSAVDSALKRKHPDKRLLCLSASHCAPAVGAFDNLSCTVRRLPKHQLITFHCSSISTQRSRLAAFGYPEHLGDRTISPLTYLRDSFQDNLQRKGRVAYEGY